METVKKYELTKESITSPIVKLYRIKALKDFGCVKAGDLGGYIQKYENLDQEGNCWVYDDARVFGKARVFGNAQVFDDAQVYGDAWVYGNARVLHYSKVVGTAQVFGNALVSGTVCVFRDAQIFGDANVFDNVRISENARVFGTARIFGRAQVSGSAAITSTDDFVCIGPIGSRGDHTTFYRCTDNSIDVACGCFSGTLEKFEEQVKEVHGDNRYGKQYEAAIECAKLSIVNT